MRAVVYRKFGGPEVLEIVPDQPLPQRKSGEVLVRVHSAGCNPLDYKFRNGSIPIATYNKVLGVDIAGVIEAADQSSQFSQGDKVFCQGPFAGPRDKRGAYAEYVAVPEGLLARIPTNLTFTEAAALPLASLSAFQALRAANVQAGQRVLVHGGNGGIGSLAVQIAKAWGCHVTSTCSTKNVEFVRGLGADEVLDYTTSSVDQVYASKPFDAVIDQVGGRITHQSMAVVKKSGHYSAILTQGMPYAKFFSRMLWGKLGMGTQYHAIITAPSGKDLQEVAQLVCDGKLKPIVAKTFLLEEAMEAHRFMETGHPNGKVVLIVVPAT